MPTYHPALIAHLRTNHGIVARRAAIALGLTTRQLDALVEVGELVIMFEGVYRHALWPATMLSRCAALCAADPSIVICCGTAALLWSFRRCTSKLIHVTTTSTGFVVTMGNGEVLHRCRVMPPDHVHERPDGIRVTSPARSMFDLAKHVRWTDLESAIEQGLRRDQFDVPTLYAVGRLLCRRGRSGSRLFAEVLESRPAFRRPVDSHPELVLLKALTQVGVRLDAQVTLALPNGAVIHPDLGDPTIGFYVEIDDHEWHGGRLDATYDDRRDRHVRLGGARVERVSTDEVRTSLPQIVAELADAYRQQRSASLSHRPAV